MAKLLTIFIITLAIPVISYAQDPGLPDSLTVGNLDGSPILTPLYHRVTVPVWLRSDDSVMAVYIPIATNDRYVTLRSGGHLYPPLSLWDDISFVMPEPDRPQNGYTNQSILGFFCLTEPCPPEDILNTGYQWWRIADFTMVVTGDTAAVGDTSYLIFGDSPRFGYGANAKLGCLLIVNFLSGDVNNTGTIDWVDVSFMVNYLRGFGLGPDPILRGDANGNCVTNGMDLIYLVNYLSGRGPAPVVGNCP